jgi:hypothetical protein
MTIAVAVKVPRAAPSTNQQERDKFLMAAA